MNTMKANEISIGDWVTVNDGTPYQIEEISKKGWVHLVDKDGVRLPLTSDYILDLIKPIPLTPEMLDRHGFTNTGGGTYTKMFNGEHYLVYVGFKYRTIEAMMSFGYSISNHVILDKCGMYLHELQHVLRICGIEKEIVP